MSFQSDHISVQPEKKLIFDYVNLKLNTTVLYQQVQTAVLQYQKGKR